MPLRPRSVTGDDRAPHGGQRRRIVDRESVTCSVHAELSPEVVEIHRSRIRFHVIVHLPEDGHSGRTIADVENALDRPVLLDVAAGSDDGAQRIL